MTKKSLRLIVLGLLCFVVGGLLIWKNAWSTSRDGKTGKSISYLVVQDQVLKTEMLGFYNSDNASPNYQEVNMVINQDETIGQYQVAEADFQKMVLFQAPSDHSRFIVASENATHQA